ncbi:MAG TPA: hypothetical protein VD864_18690 [Nocardioides sp.]|nr:hypothetical protein [Nocardioides sp.]
MSHRLPAPARLACGGVKVAVIGTMVALAISAGPGVVAGQSGATPVDADQQSAADPVLARKLARHECSPTGFGTDRQPTSALVRSARGSLRLVDFDTGWRIYTRHGAATLVAVCLDEPPR